MGSYDKWCGDIEDYTDEEVCDYSVTGVARERIVRLRLAWGWCKVRRDGAVSLPREPTVADVLVGRGNRRGQVRILAEDLYVLVTVPEDGQGIPALGPWRVEDIESLKVPGGTLLKLAEMYHKEALGELVRAVTMTKAIPRYNRTVRKSAFPEAMWGLATRQMFNKTMYRFDKERAMWKKAISDLTPPSERQ